MRFRNVALLLLSTLLLTIPTQSQTIENRIASMSLEQKVAQMFVMSFFGTELNFAVDELLSDWQVGAVVLLPSNLDNPQQITRLTNDIQQTLLDNNGFPAFISVDQEGGIIAHLEDGFTTWAVPSLLTATQNTDLAYQFGQALADEMLAVGINMNLAPVADLQTNLDNPIIGRRSFGNDPYLVAPIIFAVVEGMQANGVLATVKHFPGHGDTVSDSHIELPILPFTEDDLLQRELIPFQSAIDANVGAVMVAHIYFPQIDSEENLPSSFSNTIINGLLRDEMGYEGLVITDALDMDAIDTIYSPSNAAIRAIQAGNDLILLGAHISPDNQAIAMQAVIDAVRAGEISESRIDESVLRILTAKERMNLFSWQPLDPNLAEERINSAEHQNLVELMFRQGITQVYDNEDILPLTSNTLMIYPDTRSTLGLACNRNGWQFATVSSNPSNDDINRLREVSRYVDSVVMFTENVQANSQQQALVSALPLDKTVIVALWSPFDSLNLPEVGAYFVTYSPLSQSYAPICDILHEDAEALGTLSVMLESQ